MRAFANLANDMEAAGYNEHDVRQIRSKVEHFKDARDIVKNASGEYLDLKAYEPDMRKLIDTYIEAKEPRPISDFDEMSLVELIVKSGAAEAINERLSKQTKSKEGISETIENNIRSVLLKGQLNDPVFFENMSNLLEQIIKERKSEALNYEEYLKRIAELAKKVHDGESENLPESINTAGLKVLYNNLDENEELALSLHENLKNNAPDGWREHSPSQNRVKGLIFEIVNDTDLVERLYQLIEHQMEY